MGYEMYRLMTSRKGHIQQPKKGRKAANKEMVIDVEEEDKTKDMFVGKSCRSDLALYSQFSGPLYKLMLRGVLLYFSPTSMITVQFFFVFVIWLKSSMMYYYME